MASVVPKYLKRELVDAWAAENLKLMLLNNQHAPNAGTQRYISDVSVKEIVDSGGVYTPGGVSLAGKAGKYDTNNAFLDATDVSIGPGAYLNYRYGVVYKDTGNPAQSPIRAQIDFVTDQIVTNGTSVITWDALGIIHVA
jgi:hypothetical protein